MAIIDMSAVGKSADNKPLVHQKSVGRDKGKWFWLAADWMGGPFETEADAALDMKRIRDREGI